MTIKSMTMVVGMACIIVLLAMMVDLISGIHKAKIRGEIRSSWALKRTLTKFITYEGGVIVAAGVDMLLYFSRLFELFRLNVITGVPVVTCLVGIYLLIVEIMSIKEKADKKTKKDFSEAGELITKFLDSKTFKDALAAAIKANNEHPHGHHHDVEEEFVHEPIIEE